MLNNTKRNLTNKIRSGKFYLDKSGKSKGLADTIRDNNIDEINKRYRFFCINKDCENYSNIMRYKDMRKQKLNTEMINIIEYTLIYLKESQKWYCDRCNNTFTKEQLTDSTKNKNLNDIKSTIDDFVTTTSLNIQSGYVDRKYHDKGFIGSINN